MMRLTGPWFVIAVYVMLLMHLYAHFSVTLCLLKKSLGNTFGLIWVAIGAMLFYNIVYNHFFAMIVKPGGPKDLKVNLNVLTISRESKESEKILRKEREREA
jgi:hypothetical protein